MPPSQLGSLQLYQSPDLSHAQLHGLQCQASEGVRASTCQRGKGEDHGSMMGLPQDTAMPSVTLDMLGDEWIGSSHAEKDWGMLDEKLSMNWQYALTARKVNCILGCVKGNMASGSTEVLPSTPLW